MHDMKKTAPYAPGNQASAEAAQKIEHKLTGIRSDVFDFIASRGASGATGDEIATGLDILPYTAKPRCTELRDAGYIVDSGSVRENRNGRNETVWKVAAQVPQGAFKRESKSVSGSAGTTGTGLSVFDDVFRRNPHLRNTFRMAEVNAIRADLEKVAKK